MAAPLDLGTPLPDGRTDGLVALSVTELGVLAMTFVADEDANPENRWTLGFSQAVHRAFDAVEAWLEAHPDAPAALLTCSASPKFFSNGIDPEWNAAVAKAGDPTGEGADWDDNTMSAFARPILLPVPTVCCIGGHAFGAGLMHALGHDYRLQNDSRGFLCAPEVMIGIDIPPPELELFRYSMPVHSFHDTVLTARRWSGPEALQAGIVCQVHPPETLFAETLKFTEGLARLGAARKTYGSIKGRTKGHVARGLLEHCFYGPMSRGKPQSGPGELSPGLARLRDEIGEHVKEHGAQKGGSSMEAIFAEAKL